MDKDASMVLKSLYILEFVRAGNSALTNTNILVWVYQNDEYPLDLEKFVVD